MKLTIQHKGIDVFKNIEKIKNAKVSVGWFEDTKYDDGTKVGDVAFWQEYGTRRGIPQRPFMRPAKFYNEEKWERLLKQEVRKDIESGKPLTDAMEKLGAVVQGDIQYEITMVKEPPLKPSTIKARLRRKSNPTVTATITKPLIDTGTMLSSVSYKVEEC